MMDYLTSLITRNFELLEVIQPRLASRFEPVSPASGWWRASHSWHDTEVDEAPPESQRAWRDFQENVSPPPLHPLNLTAHKSSNLHPDEEKGQQYKFVEDLQTGEAPEEEVGVQTRPDLQQPAKAPSHPRGPRFSDRQRLPLSSQEQSPEAAEPGTRTASSGNGKQEPLVSSAGTLHPALAEYVSAAAGGVGAEPPVLSTLQISEPREAASKPPVVPSVQKAPAPLAESAETPPAPPIIRVTIGRVEVRALMAPPAPPPPRPQARPGPSNSLEDYLKEREGGKR